MHFAHACLIPNCPFIVSWRAGHSDNDTDFITTLTGLFKDIATAVEENHDMLLGSFGASFLVDFTLGLQAECDMQVRQGSPATARHPGPSCRGFTVAFGKSRIVMLLVAAIHSIQALSC